MSRFSSILVCAALALAAALFPALLVGCGASQAAPSNTVTVRAQTASLSKAQFISRGDAICRSSRGKSDPLKEEYRRLYAELDGSNEATQAPKMGAVVHSVAEITSSEVERLRSLAAPKADRETINKMLALVDSQVVLTEELASALEVSDVEGIETLMSQVKLSGAKARGIAQGYGFKVCGSD